MDIDSRALEEWERDALHSFFLSVTVPIIVEEGTEFVIVGTGTLFEVDGRLFLITAKHIGQDFSPDRWSCPETPRKGRLFTFGQMEIVMPRDDAIDFAIAELKDAEVVRRLKTEWRVLSLDDVWIPDLSADAILLAGYPSIRAKFEEGSITGRIFILRQSLYDKAPAITSGGDPVRYGVDFFVNSTTSINEFTGEDVSTVAVGGMSGCSIWAYRQKPWNQTALWSPHNALRVIGIQASQAIGTYLRGKSWGAIFAAFVQIDDELAAACRPRMQEIVKLTSSGSDPTDEQRSGAGP